MADTAIDSVIGLRADDGVSDARSVDQDLFTLQRVLTDRASSVRDLYWRALPTLTRPADCRLREDGSIAVALGTILAFNTYFGGFFEMPWRINTALGVYGLCVEVQGAPLLRIWRRSLGRQALLHEGAIDGTAVVPVPFDTINFRQHGFVFFEIIARDRPALFVHAAWVAIDAAPAPVGLAAIFCTFNREADLSTVLGTLLADQGALARLTRIIVVNQGSPGLAQHALIAPIAQRLRGRLVVIEQKNFGGAGGFGRGVLEALDDPALDHVVLLDDDIRIEPDSLLRMAAFMALARGDVPIGGHMLDRAQPTQLYEAGAVIGERHWQFQPEHSGLDVARPDALDWIVEPRAVHYNAWWCLGVPLRIIERLGMPMPVFIRGDDTEFGLRLYENGLHTVAVPGIAVWHEPFYNKQGGWHLYYETRNTLINMAINRDHGRRVAVRRMARQVLIHLMTYRYYTAALVLRGIGDYLRGPDILDGDPAVLHAGLAPLRTQYPSPTIPRSTVLNDAPVPKLPRRRLGFLAALVRAVARNARAPTMGGRPLRLHMPEFSWLSVARLDNVALETWWDWNMPLLQRSREHFRALAPLALRTLLALYRRGPAVAVQWRQAHPTLTSQSHWRSYLRLEPPASAPGGDGRVHRDAARAADLADASLVRRDAA